MPTPSFALEVQRGSIPGAPKATVFSGEFIFYVPRSERQRLICAAMFSADGAPIARFFASALRTSKIFATSLSKRDENFLASASGISLRGEFHSLQSARRFCRKRTFRIINRRRQCVLPSQRRISHPGEETFAAPPSLSVWESFSTNALRAGPPMSRLD